MSDKPSILEGGSSRNFNPVDVLGINKQSDGRSTWVLADSVEVGSLDASQNGLYLAIEDDYFAYDQIVVNVSDDLADADDATKATNKIVGKDPDLDPNNDYEVGLDEDGNLTKEMIPAAIHIVVPPRKLKYEDGKTINFDGIHVYLMDGNNHRYTDSSYPTGEIPFGELMFPVTVAESSGDVSPSGQYPEYQDEGTIKISGVGSISLAIDEAMSMHPNGWEDESGYISQIKSAVASYEGVHPAIVSVYVDDSRFSGWSPLTVCVLTDLHVGDNVTLGRSSSSEIYQVCGEKWPGEPMRVTDMNHTSGSSTVVIGQKTELRDVISSTINAVYEETGTQEIPVQWIRSDGEILEDTFEIEVGESEPPLPPQPDPWAGYADVSWGGHHYNLNRRIVPEVHYANGYLWQEGISTEYNVEQAASMGWLILTR